ncbi:high-potential iron-sulfur protein [Paraburkholderia sp. BCC1885]|uniref:high-potential iron-sulfur protein n=1 Tax=Paraburkholderia sp. BCC1885 TaxID=2562669 RepID=UPI0011830166|nr:high-potential iron-sulfur protein [Paraburkholderia sp. BCC1885]
MKNSRRSFVVFSLAVGSSLALTRVASADASKLSEGDPKALAVGYKETAAAVDKNKFATYVAGQNCSNCSLFQGKATDAWGGCLLFGSQQVAASGWCSSYANM